MNVPTRKRQRLLLILMMIFIITGGCDRSHEEMIEERWPGGEKKVVTASRNGVDGSRMVRMDEYDPEGRLVRTTKYGSGEIYTVYQYSNGELDEKRKYNAGTLIGIDGEDARMEVVERWEAGSKKVEVIYKGVGRKEIALERTAFRSDGNISRFERLDRNERRDYLYSQDGELKGIREYRNGKLSEIDGMKARKIVEESYPDGKPKLIRIYVKTASGEALFESMELRNDGQPVLFEAPAEGYSKKFSYYNNDSLKEKIEFRDGVYSGIFATYYENGQISTEKTYFDGNFNGSVKEWYEDGALRLDEVWEDSLLISGNYFSSNGTKDGEIAAGSGTRILHYSDGMIESTTEYTNGDRNGNFSVFNEMGTKLSEMILKNGVVEGQSQTWGENGRIQSETTYRGGKKHGKFIFYQDNGRKQFEVSYMNDIKHGLFISYDSRGTKKYEALYENGAKIAEYWY